MFLPSLARNERREELVLLPRRRTLVPESGKVNECSRRARTTRLYRLIFLTALDLRVFSSFRTLPFGPAPTAISALLPQHKYLASYSLARPILSSTTTLPYPPQAFHTFSRTQSLQGSSSTLHRGRYLTSARLASTC